MLKKLAKPSGLPEKFSIFDMVCNRLFHSSQKNCVLICFSPERFIHLPIHPRVMNTNILSNLAHDIRNEEAISNFEYNRLLLTQVNEVNNGGPVKPCFGNVVDNARRMLQAKEANESYLNNERGCF